MFYDNRSVQLHPQHYLAEVLGVAGTDVPVEEWQILVQPHKVNCAVLLFSECPSYTAAFSARSIWLQLCRQQQRPHPLPS